MAKFHGDILLFLVRGCPPGAEDGDYDHDDDGDDPDGDDDDQEHVAVQGRGGTSMGAVTACRGKKGFAERRKIHQKQVVPRKEF